MITLLEIVQALTPYPNVYMTLTYEQLSVFFDITLRFMPLIMTSSPRATRGLPALLSDMEDVLSMKLRLPIEDINILWSALGDRLVNEFTSGLLPKVDIDRELSVTGPSYHLGESR